MRRKSRFLKTGHDVAMHVVININDDYRNITAPTDSLRSEILSYMEDLFKDDYKRRRVTHITPLVTRYTYDLTDTDLTMFTIKYPGYEDYKFLQTYKLIRR